NQLIGQLILGFVVTQLPFNTYLASSIVMGSYEPIATVILTSFIIIQWIAIFGFHLIAALYSLKIHACAKKLLHLSANSVYSSCLSVSAKLRLAVLVEKFHTHKRYGVNYGHFGLISFVSFFKVG